MPKNPRVRTVLESEHVKGSKTLHLPARQYICHISWSMCKKISSEKSVLVVSEILRLFVNILKQYAKYSLSVKGSI